MDMKLPSALERFAPTMQAFNENLEKFKERQMSFLSGLSTEERPVVEEAFAELQKILEKTREDHLVLKLHSEVQDANQLGKGSLARRIQAKAQLRKALGTSCFPSIPAISCADMQKEVRLIVRAAEHFCILPSEVGQNQKEEYEVIDREKALQELHEMAAIEEAGKKRNRNRNKSKRKVKATATAQVRAPQPEPKSLVSETSNIAKVIEVATCIKQQVITEHPRVTQRWQTKNVQTLRTLVDTVSGMPVQKYAEKEEEELLLLRDFHYFPGLEKILINPELFRKYAFKTERGFGIVAKLIRQNVVHQGIIYFGVNTTETEKEIRHFVYHKLFEPKISLDRIFNASIEELEAGDNIDNSQEWQPVGKCSFTNSKIDGLLSVHFKKDERQLFLYPI